MTESFVAWNDLLRERADRFGQRTALAFLRDGREVQDPMTFEGLHKRVNAIASELVSRQLTGHRMLLLYPASIEFVCAFLGCLVAGVIAVPAPPPEPSRQKRSGPRLLGIIRDCQARGVLTNREALPEVERTIIEMGVSAEVLDTTAIVEAGDAAGPGVSVFPDQVAYLQYTSGSTSAPKGIGISHYNLWYQCRLLQRTCGYGDDSVTVTWMPNFHDWGLVEGLLEPVYNGTPCYLMSPFSFVRRPGNWLDAISRFRGTHSQGPNFAYEHCLRRVTDDARSGLDLTSWRVADIAAEPIQFRVMREFYEKFHSCGFRWNAFCPSFGLAEATLKVSHCRQTSAPRAMRLVPEQLEQGRVLEATDGALARTVVSCGAPCEGTRIEIVDPDKRIARPPGVVGEIWVHDPSVARGYWGQDQQSNATFDATLSADSDASAARFLRTGDLGFIDRGELFVTGRLKDLIIIRGGNHYPQDIEWTVQEAHQALQGQTSAAFSIVNESGEQLVVVQEVDTKQLGSASLDGLLRLLAGKIADEHEIEVHDIALVARGSISRTASGKVQRRAAQATWLRNEFESLASWRTSRPNASANAVEASPMIARDEHPVVPSPVAASLIEWLRAYSSQRINSMLIDQRRSVPPQVILDFGNKGLFGLQVPKDYGGLGLGFGDTVRILEQLSAIDVSLATLVFLSNTNGLQPLIHHASPELRERVLPGLAAGRQLAAFALSEPEAGSNVGAIRTRAIRQPDGSWELNGTKRWNGSAWAHFVTVIARDRDSQDSSQGISAFLVDQEMAGVRTGPESLTMGLRGIVQNSLILDRVQIPQARLLGKRGEGMSIANQALSAGRLCAAAVCLGGMKRAWQLLTVYCDRREIATGRLSDHPHTRTQISDMALMIRTLQAASRHIAQRLDQGETVAGWQTMALKVAASRAFNDATALAMQLMGGRGYMENNEIPRLFRDARSLSIGEGPNESLVGFLGNDATQSAIREWLGQSGYNELLNRHLQNCSAIATACASCQTAPEPSRSLWSRYLIGELTIEYFLSASGRPAEGESIDQSLWAGWRRNQEEQKSGHVIHLADSLSFSLADNEVDAQMKAFATDVGFHRPCATGEELEMDPLVLPPEPESGASVETRNDGRPRDTEPDGRPEFGSEKRQRLAKLLESKVRLSGELP